MKERMNARRGKKSFSMEMYACIANKVRPEIKIRKGKKNSNRRDTQTNKQID